jgi:hypothetical protein
MELVLHLADAPARAFQQASRDAGRPVLSLCTDDCQRDADGLKAKGVVFVKEPARMAYGGLDSDAGQPVIALPADQPQRRRVRRRDLVEVSAVIQVGGLATVGEPDPKTQVVVGELPGRIHAVPETVEGAEGALLAGDDLAKAQVQGAAEPGRVGPDAGQPDRPLRVCGPG